MPPESKPSFAFLVVAYNHQDYILEHLESIKYLVRAYGADIDVDLIVNDDCSRDQTCKLIDQWIAVNATLFRHVKTLFNSKNQGTCASINNMLEHMVAHRCKLTAGDDVYSFENIFELTQYDRNVAMVSGRALHLIDGTLGVDRAANMQATATQEIYKHDSLLHRFKHFSYNNAPNLLYSTECLLNPEVRSYLSRSDVVEDWPLQIAIARQYPERRLALIDRTLVYYRRTAGSTYIVANSRFIKDKTRVYDDLIKNERSSIERLRLSSRRFCFKAQNRWINIFLNADFYFFAASCLFRLRAITIKNKSVDMRIEPHQRHYTRIQRAAREFLGAV